MITLINNLNLNFKQLFNFFLLIILSLDNYLIYVSSVSTIDQITNLLLSFGVYIFYKELNYIENRIPSLSQFLLSNLLLIFIFYRSLWLFNDNDKFIYCLFPLLLLSLLTNFFSLKDFFIHLRPLFISTLLIFKAILFIPLSILLTPINTFFTWFLLNIFGFKAIVKGAQVFFENGGINITFSCSGSDQVLFCVSSMIVLSICFPLKSNFIFLKQLFFSILFALSVNIIRLSILTIFVETAHSEAFSIFDFLHGGNGSLVFSLISMILCCESYKRTYFEEKY